MPAKEIALDYQQVYRCLLKSMSYPGRVYKLPVEHPEPVLLICGTLLDHEVMFSVIGPGTSDSLISKIFEITKSEYVSSELADYVIVAGGSSSGWLESLRIGTLEFPDQGATVIYMVDRIDRGADLKFSLKGPGIKDCIKCGADGLDIKDLLAFKALNSEYPQGIDMILIDKQNCILGLPRTMQIITEI